MQLTELGDSDLEALRLILKAAVIIDDIFHEQVQSVRHVCLGYKLMLIALLPCNRVYFCWNIDLEVII